MLSFLEFLIASNLSVPTVRNYVSSIKSFFKLHNVSIQVFESPQLSLALSSLSKNWVPSVSLKPVFTPQQFIQLINHVSHLPLSILYENAFLLGFLAMLRISNMAPSSKASFDPLRDMRRGDVTVVKDSVIINLKCTKTLQRYRQSVRIRFVCNSWLTLVPSGGFFGALTLISGASIRSSSFI
jgi:hypothetical protein